MPIPSLPRFLKRLTLALLLGLACAPALARDARIVSITDAPRLPVVRADTPVPEDPGLVFYLQRSTNRNTVVYVANFDAAGVLDPEQPLSVHWRRYEEWGQTRGLNLIERRLAYGIVARPGDAAGSYRVNFRAAPALEMTLRQTAPFQAELQARQGDITLRLIYGHVEAIDGLIPQVVEIRFFGQLPNGRYATVVLVPD